MSLSTGFQYTFHTQLPLPPCKEERTQEVKSYGIKTILSLLHDPLIMIMSDKSKRSTDAIHPTEDDAVDVSQLAAEFNVALNPADNPLDGLSEWKHFRITEDIPLILGFTKTITFYSALRFNNDGMEALTDAGSGVTLYGRWQVVSSTTSSTSGGVPREDPRSLTLVEFSDTHCNRFLAWYIKSTMQKTHDDVHAFLKEKFVEKMRERRWN